MNLEKIFQYYQRLLKFFIDGLMPIDLKNLTLFNMMLGDRRKDKNGKRKKWSRRTFAK